MVLPGEVVGEMKTECSECGEKMELDVLQSNAGFYLGFSCPNCGPYSRETGYYKSKSVARRVLITREIDWR